MDFLAEFGTDKFFGEDNEQKRSTEEVRGSFFCYGDGRGADHS